MYILWVEVTYVHTNSAHPLNIGTRQCAPIMFCTMYRFTYTYYINTMLAHLINGRDFKP